MAADPKRNKTSQLRLNARLSIKSCVHNLRHSCKQCKDLKKENKERVEAGEKIKTSTHCHCPQWTPSVELMAEASHGKPYQRFKIEEKEKQEKSKIQAISFSAAREKDVEVQKKDMEKEKQNFKKKMEELKKSKGKALEIPSKEMKGADAAAEKKRKNKEKADKVAAKRKKLSFIL